MGEKRFNLGEWARWGITTLVIGLSVFYGLQTRITVLENKIDGLVPRVSALETKCDDLGEIKTDIKWIKSALMERRK